MLGRGTSSTAISTITSVIADDELLARNELAFLLKNFPEIEVVGMAANGIEAVEMIENLEPDLVFLDVQMPGLDGLGVIQRLRDKDIPLPHFVLATAFDQYAIDAFRLEALDYLLKPLKPERFTAAVARGTGAGTNETSDSPPPSTDSSQEPLTCAASETE